MVKAGEHKTVQARILAYAQEIGWRYVPRTEAEARRGFDPDGTTPEERARPASLYFGDLLHSQVRAFNQKYKEAEGALVGEFQRLNADISGNRDFLVYLRNQGKFFCAEDNRELDLTLIDYDDLTHPRVNNWGQRTFKGTDVWRGRRLRQRVTEERRMESRKWRVD
jgi:type I restriction enzyme, R subunit